jgi:acetoacetyl-CoA synthetase
VERSPTEEGSVLWAPSEQAAERAGISAYMRWLADHAGRRFASYDGLWRWSVADGGAFWQSIWDYFEVLGERGDGPVSQGDRMPGIRWFPGATINYARNALRWAADPERRDTAALIVRSESGADAVITYGQLAAEVARAQAGLRALGVGRGDRVAAYLPNIPEAVVALLATASLGAVWSACSPDFGRSSVVDRFAQIEPKVLVTVDRYRYGGKTFDRREVVREIQAALPTLAATVVVSEDSRDAGLDALPWADLGVRAGGQAADALEFEQVEFEHPLWVLYSSGTTGLPKPIVHGHGGIVLEHLKALAFHSDVGAGDVFLWFTTTGWMMWNYLVGGLLVGATVVLYDGSPAHPDLGALWRVAAESKVTFFGTSAAFITSCAKAGLEPGRDHGLGPLRAIGSTGSPLPPEGFAWVYQHVGKDVQLGSFSGGTDVCTGFVGATPLHPVRAGVIACRCLGAAVEAYDEDGRPVIDQVGELVITAPMPSMPVCFWNDPDGARYRESYFEAYPGVWRHGDWIKVLPDGGCVIYGRSDSTLNRGGVRMGTAEFYRVVDAFDEIADSLVVDTGKLGEEGRLLLFVVLAEGYALDEDLVHRLSAALRAQLSPRHMPDQVRVVPGVPRTLSGKKLEVPVRKILLGTPIDQAANRDALANPEVLDHFMPATAEKEQGLPVTAEKEQGMPATAEKEQGLPATAEKEQGLPATAG